MEESILPCVVELSLLLCEGGAATRLREVCGKSKWKFKMAFAMKGGGVSKGSRLPLSYFEK